MEAVYVDAKGTFSGGTVASLFHAVFEEKGEGAKVYCLFGSAIVAIMYQVGDHDCFLDEKEVCLPRSYNFCMLWVYRAGTGKAAGRQSSTFDLNPTS